MAPIWQAKWMSSGFKRLERLTKLGRTGCFSFIIVLKEFSTFEGLYLLVKLFSNIYFMFYLQHLNIFLTTLV
jgi:hypothetical protein